MSEFQTTWLRSNNSGIPVIKGTTTISVNEDDVMVKYYRSHPKQHPINKNEVISQFNKRDISSIDKVTKYSPLDVIQVIVFILVGVFCMTLNVALGLIVMAIALLPFATMKTEMLSIKLNDGDTVVVRGREPEVVSRIHTALK